MPTTLAPSLHVPVMVADFRALWAERQFHYVMPLAMVIPGDLISLEECAPTPEQFPVKFTGRIVYAECLGIDRSSPGLKEGYGAVVLRLHSKIFNRIDLETITPPERVLSLIQIAGRNGLEPPDDFAARQARKGDKTGRTTAILLSMVEQSQYNRVAIHSDDASDSNPLWKSAQAMAQKAGINPAHIVKSAGPSAGHRGMDNLMIFFDHDPPASVDHVQNLDPEVADLTAPQAVGANQGFESEGLTWREG